MLNDGVKIVSLTEQISLIAKETVEDFIIETIEPYCSEVAEIKISKEELKKVILKNYGTPKSKYCDRNICIKNEYNGIGCDECEVTKNQEPCEDCISRADVRRILNHEVKFLNINKWKELYEKIDDLPSIQPKPKTEWIPLKTRPMTEEETEHYFEYMDMRIDDTYTILDCPLPDDGQEVLVSWGGNVCIDTFFKDYDGCYFEGVDIDEVDAWQPLPEPYKAESEEV